MYSQTPENSAGARSGVAPNSPVSVPDAVPGTRPKAALADSEARLRLAQEAAGIGLWEYDFASGMMDWSSGQYRLYGLDPAAGPPGFSQWIGLVEPEDRDAILEAERGLLAPGAEGLRLEFRIRRPSDGAVRWLASMGRLVTGSDGQPSGIIGVNFDVTERRQAEGSLRRTAALLSAVGACSPDPIYAKDTGGRFLFANPAALSMLGRGEADVIGRTEADWNPAGAAAAAEGDRRVLETGHAEAAEEEFQADGPGRRVFRAAKAQLRMADGTPFGIVGVLSDITEIKCAEERFRATFEQAAVGMAHIGTDGSWILVNRRLCAMLGYRQADLLAMTCRGLTHPDDYPATERAIKSLLAGETATVSMEKRYIRGDGSHLWGALTMSAVRGASGAPHYMTAVVEDISQRKLAETAMRESEALFRTLFEGAPLPNYLVDPVSASIVDCNEAAARMLGYERGVLRRMKVEDIDASMLPGGDLPFRQPMLEGQPIQVETRHRMRSGGLRDVVIAVVPVDIGGRRLVHGTVVDITDLRRLTSELEALVRDEVAAREAAQARAAQAERLQALGQLAGGIAHDFNNVLQAVQGSASMVARHAGDPAAAGRYARIALDAAARGAGITRRLLAFARRGDLHAEPFAPAAILESMRHMLAPTLGSAITVRVEADACLPAILADRGHLETVLVNLAANARDAMPLGGTLSLSAAAVDVADGAVHPAHLAPGSYVRIAVTDTGDGMDAATLAQAFQPFFTTKPKGQGTGLGLAMAKGFAEQSGGGAAISSEPGKGTAVTIWLPAPVAWTPAPPGGEDAGGTAESGVRAARILVVDDDALVLETVAAQLEDEGFGVTTAADGMQALALLDGGLAVDALVSDLSMPGMDGVNLILEAQARRPGMPAVLLTGYAGDAVMLALGRRIEGPFALMRKPSQGQMLADQLLALLVKADKPVA